ncbi:hypothetical protein D3C76_736790 [compost metagenome]
MPDVDQRGAFAIQRLSGLERLGVGGTESSAEDGAALATQGAGCEIDVGVDEGMHGRIARGG